MFCVVSIIYEFPFRLLCKIISKYIYAFSLDKKVHINYNERIEKTT